MPVSQHVYLSDAGAGTNMLFAADAAPHLINVLSLVRVLQSLPEIEQEYWAGGYDCSGSHNQEKICQDALNKATLVRSIAGSG